MSLFVREEKHPVNYHYQLTYGKSPLDVYKLGKEKKKKRMHACNETTDTFFA